jgi:pyruvate,water dikinase
MIIASHIGVHPKALLELRAAGCGHIRARSTNAWPAMPTRSVLRRSAGRRHRHAHRIAFAPNPVIVRLSDFKSNEYANLIGGKRYEPHEENPMIGFRGASATSIRASRTASRWNAAR